MTTAEGSAKRAAWAACGLAVSVAFLWLAARGLDLGRLRASLAAAELLPWLPLAVASYLAGHVVRGVRCRRLVSAEYALGHGTACNVVVLGYAVNNILPARLGELARAGMLAERTGMPYLQSLAVTFLERLLDGIVILLAFGGAMAFVPVDEDMHRAGAIAALVFGGAALAVVVAIVAPALPRSLVARLLGGRGRLHDAAMRAVTSATQGAAPLRDPSVAVPVLLLSVLVWCCEAGLFAFLLPAFGMALRPGVGVLAMAFTNLGVLVPSTPGFVGVFHFFCKKALQTQGVGLDQAFAYATVVHLAFFVPVTLWGVGVMLGYGVELGRTLALVRAARESRPLDAALDRAEVRVVAQFVRARRSESPGAFLRALVDAHLVWDGLDVPAAERARVAERVAVFVEGQIGALAGPWELGFRAGLVALRLLVAATSLRDLVAMPPDARTRVVERWARGPLPPVRQLLRAVRANALLAFYDEPSVEAALARAAEPGAPRRLAAIGAGA